MRYMKEDRKYEVGNIIYIYIWCIQFAYRDEEFNFSSLVISIALVKNEKTILNEEISLTKITDKLV